MTVGLCGVDPLPDMAHPGGESRLVCVDNLRAFVCVALGSFKCISLAIHDFLEFRSDVQSR